LKYLLKVVDYIHKYLEDMQKLYTAALMGRNRLQIYDVKKGIRAYTINLGNVDVSMGPIITGDRLTVVVKELSGKQRGKVYTLPKGILSYTFPVS
jgi:hypothetical protein